MRGSGSRDRSGAKSYSCAWCRHSKQSQDQEKEGSICIATKCWCDADVFVNVFSQLSHVYCSLSHLLQFFPIIPVSSENDCWLFFDKGKEEASKFGVFSVFFWSCSSWAAATPGCLRREILSKAKLEKESERVGRTAPRMATSHLQAVCQQKRIRRRTVGLWGLLMQVLLSFCFCLFQIRLLGFRYWIVDLCNLPGISGISVFMRLLRIHYIIHELWRKHLLDLYCISTL